EEGPQGLLLLLEHVEDLVSLAESTDLVLEFADAPVDAEMIDGAPFGVLDVDVGVPLPAQVRQALLDPGDLLPDLVDPGVETGELLLDVGEAAFVGEADDVAVVRLPVRSAVAVAGLPGRGDPGTFPVQRRRVGHAEMVSSLIAHAVLDPRGEGRVLELELPGDVVGVTPPLLVLGEGHR